jgi:hypothetical protein
MRHLLLTIATLALCTPAWCSSLASLDTSGTFAAGVGETELVTQRTRGAKVFDLGPVDATHHKYRIGAGIGPFHYPNDPFNPTSYNEIDLTLLSTPTQDWQYACETNGYAVHIWQSRVIGANTVRYIAQFRRGGVWFGMAPIGLAWMNDAGQYQLIGTPAADITPTIDNDAYTVTWANCFGPGLDFRYNLQPDKFFKTLIVHAKANLPTPTIGVGGLRLTIIMSVVWAREAGATNGTFSGITLSDFTSDLAQAVATPDQELVDPPPFSFQDRQQRVTWWVQRPMAWDSATPERHDVTPTWRVRRKGTQAFALFSITAGQVNSAQTVYPIYIDTAITEIDVSASTDDAYCRDTTSLPSTGFSATGHDFGLGFRNPYYYINGYRFLSVPIPKNATINSATIGLYDEGTQASLTVKIYGEAVDNSVTFAAGHTPYNAYSARTTASYSWTQGSTSWNAHTTLYGKAAPVNDLSGIVGEITSRSGWASGNALTIIITDDGTNTAGHLHYSYDTMGTPQYSARFNATYTAAAPATIYSRRGVGNRAGSRN